MASQSFKKFFCGSSGCCIMTSPSEEEFETTYKKFEEKRGTLSSVESDQRNDVDFAQFSKNERNIWPDTDSKLPVEEIELDEVSYQKDVDDDELPTWRGEDLCDLHRNSIRRRRQSLSLSNLIDLTESDTNLNGPGMTSAEKRCTFPPSRRKFDMYREKPANHQNNAAGRADLYQYYRLNANTSTEDDVVMSDSTSSSSVSTKTGSLEWDYADLFNNHNKPSQSLEWDYTDLYNNPCFQSCTTSDLPGTTSALDKPCEGTDIIGDSYTLYNVNRCPLCKVNHENKNTSNVATGRETLVHLFI